MNKYFFKVLLTKYADFKGRATRKEFFLFYLFSVLIVSLGLMINPFVFFLVSVIFLIPVLAIKARRLRDAGVSNFLCYFMPIATEIGFDLMGFFEGYQEIVPVYQWPGFIQNLFVIAFVLAGVAAICGIIQFCYIFKPSVVVPQNTKKVLSENSNV